MNRPVTGMETSGEVFDIEQHRRSFEANGQFLKKEADPFVNIALAPSGGATSYWQVAWLWRIQAASAIGRVGKYPGSMAHFIKLS